MLTDAGSAAAAKATAGHLSTAHKPPVAAVTLPETKYADAEDIAVLVKKFVDDHVRPGATLAEEAGHQAFFTLAEAYKLFKNREDVTKMRFKSLLIEHKVLDGAECHEQHCHNGIRSRSVFLGYQLLLDAKKSKDQ
jgi:hypothetical protein